MDHAHEEGKRQTFWLSFFSAIGVLVTLGVIIYLSSLNI